MLWGGWELKWKYRFEHSLHGTHGRIETIPQYPVFPDPPRKEDTDYGIYNSRATADYSGSASAFRKGLVFLLAVTLMGTETVSTSRRIFKPQTLPQSRAK